MSDIPKKQTAHQQQTVAPSKAKELSRLGIKGIVALTDVVESLHRRINPLIGVRATSDPKQRLSISGSVYNNIRNITGLIGKSIEEPLDVITLSLAANPNSHTSQAMLSALNGVLGDQLVNTQNPLAISMRLRKNGLVLDESELVALTLQNKGKVLILVHGLCMNDLQWCHDEHDHGEKLAEELGMSVVYLHYNTGRHISDNGQDFADILQSLVLLSKQSLEISILAHSMGGLVSRSAFHYAKNRDFSWPKQVNKLIFLGTPHHGAPLEKAGNWLDLVLASHHYTIPFARLVKVRSAGITDLRYGNVQKSDWDKVDRFEYVGDQRSPLPLPNEVQCFAIASSVTKSSKGLLGDGLVPVQSALGQHENPLFDLHIPERRTWIGININHMQLLSEPKVYLVLRQWLEQD